MGNLGSKNTIKINKHDNTLIEMKLKCRELKKFNKNIEGRIETQIKRVREEMAKGNKSEALKILKYKKTLDRMLKNSTGSLFNLKELIDKIEMTQLEVELTKSLQKGGEALREIQKEMPIGQVEKIMEEVSDAIECQKEISDMLSGSIGNIEDEDLLDELKLLEDEIINDLKETMPSAPEYNKKIFGEKEFPEVPQDIPADKTLETNNETKEDPLLA